VDADRVGHVLPLRGLADELVVDPLQPVAGDLPAGLPHPGHRLGVAGQRGGDAVDGDGQAPLGEHPPQPPEAGAGAVLVDRLHVDVAHAQERLRAHDLGEESLGGGVAVQHAVLAALLVIEDELHRDVGAAGPARVGRVTTVADQVAGVMLLRHA
jgi:hypothetical protein